MNSLSSRRRGHGSKELSLAKALGWFSIGLGVAELLMPRRVSRMVGVRRNHQLLVRLLGLREMGSGAGILGNRRAVGWIWSRVAGDVMDLALLGSALCSSSSRKNRLIAATAAVAGVTMADLFCGEARRGGNGNAGLGRRPSGPLQLTRVITIDRSPEELHAFWRNFENLPRFMAHLESVQVTEPGRSHWVATAPLGGKVEWDAEIVDDRPSELLAWRSLPGAGIPNSGSVRFKRAHGGRGTVVEVELHYEPPGGRAGALFAKLFGEEPGEQIKDDLRCFKQLMETGVIATTEGQPAGRKRSTSKKFDHPTPEVARAEAVRPILPEHQ